MKANMLFSLVLISMSSGALAEWTEIGTAQSSELGDRTIYIDHEKTEKKGSLRKVSELQDLANPSNGALSMQTQSEFDCRRGTVRILSLTAYSGHMAKGKVIYANFEPRKVETISNDKASYLSLICH